MSPFNDIEDVIEFLQNITAENLTKMVSDGTIDEFTKEARLNADLLEESSVMLQQSLKHIGRG